jgi:tetratricopeptide (TPR) repeat protein
MLGRTPRSSKSGQAPTSTSEANEHGAAGDRHRDRGEWAAAVDSYSRFLDFHPENADIWVQLGNCAKEAGLFERSMSAYERALEIVPASADLHLQIGHLQKLRRMPGLAIKAYKRALEIDPSLPDAAAEVRALSERHAQLPFLDFESFLDEMRFGDIDQLIAHASRVGSDKDPFARFAKLVHSKK